MRSRVVAGAALDRLTDALKLPVVNILMTAYAFLGRRLERNLTRASLGRRLDRNLARAGLGRGRTMTVEATEGAVQAGQRPFRYVMIEWLDLAPRAHAVTGLAQFLAALQTGFEKVRILPMMRVLMTPVTRPVRKMVLAVGPRRSGFFAMTILTRHRRVRPV